MLELRKWLRERMMVIMRKVRTIEEIVGEDVVEIEADRYVDKIRTAVNLEGRLHTGIISLTVP